MEKEVLKEPMFVKEIVTMIKSGLEKEQLLEKLHDYHENDIAQSLEYLTKDERISLYNNLGTEWISDIFSYIEEPDEYIEELGVDKLAAVINEMDSDDAVDLLDDMDESIKEQLSPILDEDVKADIRLIKSYDDDEIGSLITTNYIKITKDLTIRQAMHAVIRQAGDNDNISTIYVVDQNDKYCGAIDLKELIIAREYDNLDDIISYSYPYLLDHEKVSESIEKIKDYAEDSLPVLNDEKKIIGIITAQDVIEAVDDEMGVSTVVGAFEAVVAVLPIIICFQSLILDMAGNVGTQSLAVTIRVLMDEDLKAKDKAALIFKEMKVGFSNGLLLGILSLCFLGVYIGLFKGYTMSNAFVISGCVGISLLVAMIVSSLVGTIVPLFFHEIKVDPAVASGPLITTVNDLVAVVIYYGLSWILLIQWVHLV